jgi:feruloyl esterase
MQSQNLIHGALRHDTKMSAAEPNCSLKFSYEHGYSIFAACIVFLHVVVIGASARASEKPQIACDQLTAVRIGTERLSISFAKSVQSDEKTSVPHCVLRGALEERTGLDGKPYAIGFEIRLPDAWNGRYFHQANGGADGEVVPAYGPLLGGDGTKNALTLGYAVLSSDAGHNGKAFPEYVLAGGSAFGLDPQARLDYGYTSTPKLFRLAQDVLKAYYGRAQDYSYMVGCSNGGRHAMIAASRYPRLFHGILAGSPGFDLPRAALKGPSDTQAVLKNGLDIRSAFSREDLQFVSREIVRACDKLDGAADEIVGDLKACQKAFDLKSLQCTGEKSPACLSPAQVSALQGIMAGPRTSDGKQLYPPFPFDPGIASANWRFWRLESTIPPWDRYPLTTTLGSASLAMIFTTPPTKIEGKPAALLKFQAEFNLDKDAQKIYATSGLFTESAMDFMSPPDRDDPKLAEFKQAGGRMIIFHGHSDGPFSINATIDWYEKLVKNNEGDATSFVRFYPIPGMAHCLGGPATDRIELFSALVDWVEKGKATDTLIASARADNTELPVSWSKERTRPLCNWPLVARYNGSGDLEKAESFSCRP